MATESPKLPSVRKKSWSEDKWCHWEDSILLRILVFRDRASLGSLGCPGAHSAKQVGLPHTDDALPPESWVKDVHHYCQQMTLVEIEGQHHMGLDGWSDTINQEMLEKCCLSPSPSPRES